jgi:hypothetical protein
MGRGIRGSPWFDLCPELGSWWPAVGGAAVAGGSRHWSSRYGAVGGSAGGAARLRVVVGVKDHEDWLGLVSSRPGTGARRGLALNGAGERLRCAGGAKPARVRWSTVRCT